MKISAIIPAAGTGSRYSPVKNKLLEELNGIPVLMRTLKAVSSVGKISEIIVCTSCEKTLSLVKDYKTAPGGRTRQESVFNGLKIADNPDLVIIHDGARPLVAPEVIKNTIKTAIKKGAAIAAVPAKDTIKKVNPKTLEVIETPDRAALWNVQTPQVFRFCEILDAHRNFENLDFTDDAALMEKAGYKVYVVKSSYKNIKITTEEDLRIAGLLINP